MINMGCTGTITAISKSIEAVINTFSDSKQYQDTESKIL